MAPQRTRPFAIAAALVAALLAFASSPPAAASAPPVPVVDLRTAVPATPAGRQLAWLLDASTRPLTDDEIRSHFSPWTRATLNPDDVRVLLTSLGAAGPPGLTGFLVSTPLALRAGIAVGSQQIDLEILTGHDGLLVQVLPTLRPGPPPSLTSWDALDTATRALAPRAQLFVAVDDADSSSCEPVHALDGETARPIGSQFKLLVLGALARQVAEGQGSWADRATVEANQVSLPTGITQEEVGATLTTADLAARMIAISDNTAADVLLARAGRRYVERAQQSLGVSDPTRNRPFLSTRELFQLKLLAWPGLAQIYGALPDDGQRLVLRWLQHLPAPTIEQTARWTAARALDGIEWLATPADVCRTFRSLAELTARPGNAPVGEALALNDGGLALDRARYPTTWFKGGAEVGLVALAYRVIAADGRVVTVVLNLSDPNGVVDEQVVAGPALDIVRSAIELALATAPVDEPAPARGLDSPDRPDRPDRA